MATHKDPIVKYDADEEAALERHEKMGPNGFAGKCRTAGCTVCGGPELPAARETPEGEAPAAETPEDGQS